MSKKYNKNTYISEKGSIFVGMPRERVFIPAFVDNRDKLLATLRNSGRSAGYYQAEGHRVDINRDLIVNEFLSLKDKPEWLLMIDTDMEHPLDLPLRLTKWRKPIVAGLYFYRGNTFDPFMFKNAPKSKDKYGRMLRQWRPMRDPVYKFLRRNGVLGNDGYLALDNPQGKALIECDAVATGAMVIHRSVLELMKKPVFEYRPFGTSEDLQFCQEAKEDYGVPIYCDISTISGHYRWEPMGYSQFMQLYENFGLQHTLYTMEGAASLLEEFLHIPHEVAHAKIISEGAHKVGEYWNARFKGRNPAPEEVQDFYHDEYTGQLYLTELIYWNAQPMFNKLRAQYMGVRDRKVLDFGAGIGTIALQMALQGNNVVACEANSYLRRFIQFWQKKLEKDFDKKIKLKIVDEFAPFEGGYDYIFAIDVLEHLPENQVRMALKVMHDMLKPRGRLVYHANFKQQDIFPMHFDYSEHWDEWLAEAKFIQIGDFEAMRLE